MSDPVAIPHGEHEVKSTIVDDSFADDHPPRTDSPTFTATKKTLHGQRCCISGHTETVEQHHATLEYSLQFGVDWYKVKGIATGEVKELPILDPATDKPTGEMAPVEDFLIHEIIQYTSWKGFDWNAFDPAKPETFVDSIYNMKPISKLFHTGKRGIHRHSFPFFLFFAWPRLPDYIYTPDEETPTNLQG